MIVLRPDLPAASLCRREQCVKFPVHCGFVACTSLHEPHLTTTASSCSANQWGNGALILVFPLFQFVVVLLSITRVICGGKKKEGKFEFCHCFEGENLTNSIQQIQSRTSSNWISDLCLEKQQNQKQIILIVSVSQNILHFEVL